jgi:hypothetical protein
MSIYTEDIKHPTIILEVVTSPGVARREKTDVAVGWMV